MRWRPCWRDREQGVVEGFSPCRQSGLEGGSDRDPLRTFTGRAEFSRVAGRLRNRRCKYLTRLGLFAARPGAFPIAGHDHLDRDALTLATDFQISDALHHLVERLFCSGSHAECGTGRGHHCRGESGHRLQHFTSRFGWRHPAIHPESDGPGAGFNASGTTPVGGSVFRHLRSWT